MPKTKMAKKVDNRSIASKVAIRLWLIEKLGLKEIRVLDACAGTGKVWAAMEEHVDIRRWTKVDVQPRMKGTLKMDAAVAISKFDLSDFNLIDIDTYGEPWGPYFVLLQRLQQPMGVFLTHGHSAGSISKETMEMLSVPIEWHLPFAELERMISAEFVDEQCLARTWDFVDVSCSGMIRYKHRRAIGPSGVTYYALGLTPKA